MSKKEKKPFINKGTTQYLRLPIKTHVIMANDNLLDVLKTYACSQIEPGDVLFISEKIVAITQGRALPLNSIKPRPLARLLSKFVIKTPAGIGLGMPETMEMALQECGTPLILWAALASAATKIFGKRGVFYEIAGRQASSIDGPTPNTIPPYNQYVVLGPKDPDQVAQEMAKHIGCPVAIVDINDIDGVVLGLSNSTLSKEDIVAILSDNPLGQDHEQTPLGLIRQVHL